MVKPGSPYHRDLFCSTFVETHKTFDPKDLPWPVIEGKQLEALKNFPFWGYARSLEQRAGRMVTAYSHTVEDPVIRHAVSVQAVEEERHGRLMEHVLERYNIQAPPLLIPDGPPTAEEFRVFGFGECTDSFIGFGAFSIVREKKLFPQPLLDIFDNVLWEEARHVVFFINWWRYEQARAGKDHLLNNIVTAAKYHIRAIQGTAEGAADVPGIAEMTGAAAGEILDGVTPKAFIEHALAENRRMMGRLDPRLFKPRLIPTIGMIALLALRLLPPRAAAVISAKPSLAA